LNYEIPLVEKGGISKYDTKKDDLHKKWKTKFNVALLTATMDNFGDKQKC